MAKTIISVSLDDEVIKAIDNEKGEGGTRSGFLNIRLRRMLLK